LGVALITPASGIALAVVAIVAVFWLAISRQRARRRYGLAVSGTAMTVARIVIPSVLIALFIYLMNVQGGVPLPVIILLAVAIGGTSLMGGRGKVSGALLGALVMASLDNGMSLLSVENATQYIIKGAVLVAAVGFDMAGRRKS